MAERCELSVYVAPRHLSSLAAICAVFERGKQTIRKWHKMGAPIAVMDGRYTAEYNVLQAWVVEQSKNI